jgi:hypothetical protein
VNFEEFAAWLGEEMREGRLEEYQVADLLAQRLMFDERRSMIESEFRRQAVGYIANDLQAAGSVAALLDQTARAFPDRMLYFEPIGYRFF